MKKELEYFRIEYSIGWNQNWFPDWSMYDGGCAAVTACDLCIYLAQQKALSTLYPYNPNHLTRKNYLSFSAIMKPYLRPRWQGIDTLELYISGLSAYWHYRKIKSVRATALHGNIAWQEARELIREQIDNGIIVTCLLLYHKSLALQDFHWLNLQELWDTGHRNEGGLIRLSLERTNHL